MIKNKAYLFLFLSLAVLFSCKKYDEGKNCSFRSADYRIKGNHKIVSYIVNGVDSTDYLVGGPKEIYFYHEQHDPAYFEGYNEGSWELSKDKRWIIINGDNYTHLGTQDVPLGTTLLFYPKNSRMGWRIIKLTTTEFKIKTTYNNINYEIHFAKK